MWTRNIWVYEILFVNIHFGHHHLLISQRPIQPHHHQTFCYDLREYTRQQLVLKQDLLYSPPKEVYATHVLTEDKAQNLSASTPLYIGGPCYAEYSKVVVYSVELATRQ